MDPCRLSAAVVVAVISGCNAEPQPSEIAPTADARPPQLVPPPDVPLPRGVAAATTWIVRGEMGALRGDRHALASAALNDVSDRIAVGRTSERSVLEQAPEWFSSRVTVMTGGDDSVAGEDWYLIFLLDARGWHLEDGFVRTLCRRGVSSDSDLCV